MKLSRVSWIVLPLLLAGALWLVNEKRLRMDILKLTGAPLEELRSE